MHGHNLQREHDTGGTPAVGVEKMDGVWYNMYVNAGMKEVARVVLSTEMSVPG